MPSPPRQNSRRADTEAPDEWRPIEGGEPAKEISEDEEAAAYYEIKCNELGQANSRLKAELAAANAKVDTVNIANAKQHAELKDNRCEMARLRAELEGHAVDSERLRKLLRKVQNIAASGDVPF